jgi:hypothetical protein
MDPAPAPIPIDDPALAERLIPIVVGAHPRAEADDRPIAYALAAEIERRLDRAGGPAPRVTLCTDLWYLNDDRLRTMPTVSVGGPEVNALSAFLGDRVPSAFAIDGRLVVQMDLELGDPVACCWGVGAEATRAATEAFSDRYLDLFLDAALRRWSS